MRWHSSLWKLLWKELLVYTVSFLAISLLYRFALTGDQQVSFGLLVRWCSEMYAGIIRRKSIVVFTIYFLQVCPSLFSLVSMCLLW